MVREYAMIASSADGAVRQGLISTWIRRQLANPQLVGLVLVLSAVALTIYLAGQVLAPVIAAMIIAYLLTGLVRRLRRLKVPKIVAVALVYLLFLSILFAVVFGLIPLLVRQLSQLVQQVPQIMSGAQNLLLALPGQYPQLFSEEQIRQLVSGLGSELVSEGQRLVTFSVTSAVTLLTVGIYLILVPFLVFFMVRDEDRILTWMGGFLPRERQLTDTVWAEVNEQIGNYIGGKAWEILIVGMASFIVFSFLDLQYAVLLAAVTGLSVLIPYVGAAVVTLPVALVAYFQWGFSTDFVQVIVAYGIIQALDGNVLSPLLFSEAVNLHPVAIIVAILVFGGMWGFWGVFFAIPLATVTHAVIRAWPRNDGDGSS
jgi:putative permease